MMPGSAPIWRFAGWAAVAMAGTSAVSALCFSCASKPGPQAHNALLAGFVLLGCALGLGQAMWRRSGDSRPIIHALTSSRFWLLAVGLGVAQSSLLCWCGMRQFSGFDLGVVVETGWRLAQGQRPYLDFPCTLPPAFFLGAGYAFKLFGVSWRALTVFTALVSLGMFFWTVWLGVRLFAERGLALLLSFTVQALTMVLMSFWWYNSITSASAAIFLLSSALLWSSPDDWASRFSYFAALFLLALMKPNVAGVLIFGISVIFCCSKRHRWLVLALSAGAFASFVVFLAANRLSLLDMLQAYSSVSGHAWEMRNTMATFKDMGPFRLSFYMLAVLAAVLPAVISIFARGFRIASGSRWIGVTGILSSVHPLLVNGELKLVDLVPALIGAILVAAGSAKKNAEQCSVGLRGFSGRLVTGLLVMFAFAGTGIAVARERLRMDGYGVYFEYALVPGVVKDGFFKGVHAGPTLHEVLDEIRDLLHGAPNATVFFGPRLGWAYASFDKPSPRNQPISWDPGIHFGAEEGGKYLIELFQSGYDLIVLSANGLDPNDTGAYPGEIFQYLVQNYGCELEHHGLAVWLRLRSAVPSVAARAFVAKGRATAKLIAELHKSLAANPDTPAMLNNLAWLLASNPYPELRNGSEAVGLARRACELTRYGKAVMVGTLGAAYAEAGRFDEAVAMAEKARDLAAAAGDTQTARKNGELVKLFKTRLPYRESGPK